MDDQDDDLDAVLTAIRSRGAAKAIRQARQSLSGAILTSATGQQLRKLCEDAVSSVVVVLVAQ